MHGLGYGLFEIFVYTDGSTRQQRSAETGCLAAAQGPQRPIEDIGLQLEPQRDFAPPPTATSSSMGMPQESIISRFRFN